MTRVTSFPIAAASLAALCAACLPEDTRPPPAELLITASPDDALVTGVTTDDGWTLTFTRFLVSVGHISAEGDECIGYSDPDYARVLRMNLPGAQKVNTLFALGTCELDYELSSPQDDSVLGEQATAADRDFLRTPGTNLYALESGTSIYAEGHASSGAVSKTFGWAYRQRIDYASCRAIVDGRVEAGVVLAENESTSVDIEVHGATLFQEALRGDAITLGFQVFADADGNADGDVTFEELRNVNLADIAAEGRYADAEIAAEGWTTLEDYVYLGLFPRVLRYRGNGTCEQEMFPNDRVPR